MPPLFKLTAAAAGRASWEKGRELERRVARVLRLEGFKPVRNNVMLVDRHGNKSEIDLVAGSWRKRFVECKNYGADRPVPLEDVAKFRAVLELHGIPLSRSIFVTTSTFSPRALTMGIRTVDGKQLVAWERRAGRWRAARVTLLGALATLLLAGGTVAAAPAVAAYMQEHSKPVALPDALQQLVWINWEFVRGWRAGGLAGEHEEERRRREARWHQHALQVQQGQPVYPLLPAPLHSLVELLGALQALGRRLWLLLREGRDADADEYDNEEQQDREGAAAAAGAGASTSGTGAFFRDSNSSSSSNSHRCTPPASHGSWPSAAGWRAGRAAALARSRGGDALSYLHDLRKSIGL